ncbi:Syntaxin-like protein psy1 [Sphaceloma murrayae]|uniref:Syntaxin-like protein psy1 n=1 Tax=Sphaceloma murrayae TaxID=2082308 RepID=A0A2K1QH78_9PEZI|nr:Syntaxin-like protein psy1 [Sphaceloma murrayae]
MAYNNGYGGGDRYGGGGGYGQSNPYQSNPYEQQQNPYSSQQQNPYATQGNRYDNSSPYNQHGGQGQSVEMQNLQQNEPNPFGDNQTNGYGAPPQQNNPHAILNECREVQRAIDDLEGDLQTLQRAQRGFVNGTGAQNREIDAMGAEIMGTYRALADRVKRIKSKPEAGNPQNAPQVGNLDRRIKKAINAFQQQESAFRKEVQEQQRRQYLIVNPDATESELREVSEAGGDTQIFQQALLSADRRGQAQSTLRSVQQRHDAIQQIERTMMELAQLFQDLDAIVVEQDPMIQNVEKHAEDTQQHMVEANVQLEQATTKARAARKKKWICLGIVVAIIVIVAIIVVAYGASQGWFRRDPAPAAPAAATRMAMVKAMRMARDVVLDRDVAARDVGAAPARNLVPMPKPAPLA